MLTTDHPIRFHCHTSEEEIVRQAAAAHVTNFEVYPHDEHRSGQVTVFPPTMENLPPWELQCVDLEYGRLLRARGISADDD